MELGQAGAEAFLCYLDCSRGNSSESPFLGESTEKALQWETSTVAKYSGLISQDLPRNRAPDLCCAVGCQTHGLQGVLSFPVFLPAALCSCLMDLILCAFPVKWQ